MVLTTEAQINDVLEHRVTNINKLGTITAGYIDKVITLHNHINGVLTSTTENPLPQLSLDQLRELRKDIEIKRSLAQDRLNHWAIQFSSMDTDLDDLRGALDESSVNLRREELKKQLMVMKKRVDELSKKRTEIKEINSEIAKFDKDSRDSRVSHGRLAEITLSEEELEEVFGDKKAKVLGLRSLEKTREYRDVEVSEDGSENTVIQRKLMPCWRIKASVFESVSSLKEFQNELLTRAAGYEDEIRALKAQYIEKVKMFEAIKRILGMADEDKRNTDTKAATEEPEDEEEDLLFDDMASDHDLSEDARDDEELLSEVHSDQDLENSDAEAGETDLNETIDHTVSKDLESDVVMAE